MLLSALSCVLVLSFGLLINGNPSRVENVRENSRDWMSLCKCARPSLRRMQRLLADYTAASTRPNAPQLDDLINQITDIAYNCTRQPQCRCPEGYFKTNDGYHCLKISDERVSCDEAMNVCSRDLNARLAVAKDHIRLTNLADEIRHVVNENSDDFYWIGLSYNRTEEGIPVWTWEDGSAASYNITSVLTVPVRKSIDIRIDVNGEPQSIERVAISKNYEGQHWRQEKCGRTNNGRIIRHKYICEFVMFKVEIKAVTANPTSQENRIVSGRAGIVQS